MRRTNDFYPTPAWATEILLQRVRVQGSVLEPCTGEGHISHVLNRSPRINSVTTNDIDPRFDCDWHLDGLGSEFAKRFRPDWIVSNPPFSIADLFVPRCLEIAEWGVAMLLRLSWLEPTKARGEFLEKHPPSRLMILPRISFDGSGKTDNVTAAWFVWDRQQHNNQLIEIVPRRATQEVQRAMS